MDILDSTLDGLPEAEQTRRMDAFRPSSLESAGGNYIIKIINDPLLSRDHRERNDSQ